MTCATAHKRPVLRTAFFSLLVAASALAACSGPPEETPASIQALDIGNLAAVLTQHNDNRRTGANLEETVLTTANVNRARFGKLFARDLPEGAGRSAAEAAQVYAQPLYVPRAINGRNVVYVATERNNVYAYDADDAAATAPLWSVNLGVPQTGKIPSAYGPSCQDLTPAVGITGTPVIDAERETMFLVAKTMLVPGKPVYKLHALDIVTGAARPGTPVTIAAVVDREGRPTPSGTVRFDAYLQLQRPGLLLKNGTVYIGFGSHCDYSTYHGWVLGYDAQTFAQVAVYNTTPSGKGGSLWQAGGGITADDEGNLYFITGNGTFDTNLGKNLGTAFVKVARAPSGALSTSSWFMPSNVRALDRADQDLGSSSALLVPGTNLVVGGGKEGVLYVLDKDKMGGFNSRGDTQIIQRFKAGTSKICGSPVYWEGPTGRQIYVWPQSTSLTSYAFDGARFGSANLATSSRKPAHPGGILALSANGNQAGTGILWATLPAVDSNHKSVAGTLYAFDASDIKRELWNSAMDARDALGSFAKFTPPTIVNGKVYLATHSNQLVVYGLRPAPVDAGVPDPQDAATGVDAGGPIDPGPAATFTQIYNDYMKSSFPARGRCSDSGCHGRTSNGGFLCGTTKDACYNGLVNRGLIIPQTMGDSKRSLLADPEASPLIWISPNGSMPRGNLTPNPQAAAAIRSWIRNGAAND